MDNNGTMTTAASWGLILGVVTPYLVAVINQARWNDKTRRAVALVISVLVGLGNALFNGEVDFSATSAMASIAAVVIAAQTSYAHLLKPLPSGVQTLEQITTIGPSSAKHAPGQSPGA
jgi:hypothetical protein